MPADAARILAVLPHTQCTRCGYPDCAAYAAAIANDEAAINQCPPGGAEGIARLAQVTGQPAIDLNPDNGSESPRGMAVIDEDWCIGCTLCIAACPTDAILGSHKRMHTVIEPYCTGCELCLPVCPVDCIQMENVTGSDTGWAAWSDGQAALAASRYRASRDRRQRETQESADRRAKTAQAKLMDLSGQSRIADTEELERKRAFVEAALLRARARRAKE